MEEKIAIFEVKIYENRQLVKREEKKMSFDLLHVVPPQSAPNFVKSSPIAVQDGRGRGWAEVDIHTLQHPQYKNVFALGDVANLPTGKTGAAVRKQAPVIVNNIKRMMNEQALDKNVQYNGYSACPILTDYQHVLMAEFIYGYKAKPSISFMDTTKPSWLMYLAKHFYLPWFYWNRMLKGKG